MLGTKKFLTRKLDQHSRIEKYKYRLVAPGLQSRVFFPDPGEGKYQDGVRCHRNSRLRCPSTRRGHGGENESYIELPHPYMLALVEKIRNGTQGERIRTLRLDPCLFRWVSCGQVAIISIVNIDDSLVVRTTKRDEEQGLVDFYSCFPIKDLEEPSEYLIYIVTRDRDAGRLKCHQRQYVLGMKAYFGIANFRAIPSEARGRPLPRRTGHRRMPRLMAY